MSEENKPISRVFSIVQPSQPKTIEEPPEEVSEVEQVDNLLANTKGKYRRVMVIGVDAKTNKISFVSDNNISRAEAVYIIESVKRNLLD